MNASMYKRKRPTVASYVPGKHDCGFCRRDLTNEVRIRDVDCKLESGQFMELCPECFAAGVEIGGHKVRALLLRCCLPLRHVPSQFALSLQPCAFYHCELTPPSI